MHPHIVLPCLRRLSINAHRLQVALLEGESNAKTFYNLSAKLFILIIPAKACIYIEIQIFDNLSIFMADSGFVGSFRLCFCLDALRS